MTLTLSAARPYISFSPASTRRTCNTRRRAVRPSDGRHITVTLLSYRRGILIHP